MHRQARFAAFPLALVAALLAACGGDAGAVRAKRAALEHLDAQIRQLVELSSRANEEGIRLSDDSEAEMEVLGAKTRTLRSMADRSPLEEVQARARSIEFEAGSRLDLWRTRMDSLLAERAAGRRPREPGAPSDVVGKAEQEREVGSRYAKLSVDVVTAYEHAAAELKALVARTAGVGSHSNDSPASEVVRVEQRLLDAHGHIERAGELGRRSQPAAAVEELERAKLAIDLASSQLAEARTESARRQTEEGRVMPAAKFARGKLPPEVPPDKRESAPPADPPIPAPVSKLSAEYLYRQCASSVVAIFVYDYRRKPTSLGTGFFVSSDGHIVTNFHVIRGIHSAEAVLGDGRTLPVTKLLATDTGDDLALLSVDFASAPHLDLADAALPQVGSQVFAIGTPRGLASTLSEGIISAHRRSESGALELQTTAPVSPGSSGGPLLSSEGKVVGVVYATVVGGQNLNLVVPAVKVRDLLAQRTTPLVLATPGPPYDLYAAIAFDKATGRYAGSFNQLSRKDAEIAARKAAGGGADAVAWTCNGWCAIAFGKDGSYGVASGSTKAEASSLALRACERRTTGCYVAQVIPADGDLE